MIAGRNRGQHAPLTKRRLGQQRLPDLAALWIRLHERLHRAAANQSVVPAEIIVEHSLECEWLARFERPQRLLPRLGFEAAAAKGPDDASIRQENRLRATLLRGRA